MKNLFQQIYQKGKRANNEDYLLADPANNFFIVCDGVGGSNKGEEASKLATQTFSNFFQNKKKITPETLKIALKKTEDVFDAFIEKNPESSGMATTLTFLYLTDNKAILAHCGDSRIYHIRDAQILHQTKDHSFVQELVDSGYVTAEAAKNHPKKNQITRAIQGSKKRTSLEIVTLDAIQNKDYFLLCSDGILESIDNVFIQNNFLEHTNPQEIKEAIETICLKNSNDNFSAIIIKINNPNNGIALKKHPLSKLLLPAIAIVIMGLFCFWFNQKNKKEPEKSIKNNSEKTILTNTNTPQTLPKNTVPNKPKDTTTTPKDTTPTAKNNTQNWKIDFTKKLALINQSKNKTTKQLKNSYQKLKEEIKKYKDNKTQLEILDNTIDDLTETVFTPEAATIIDDKNNANPKKDTLK